MPEELQDKIEKAVEYASSSNGLENNGLTEQEMDMIIGDIQSGKTDEGFIEEVVTLVKTLKPGETSNQGERIYARSK